MTESNAVVLPPMTPPQHQAWSALLSVYDAVPTGWTLVGGQMVALHCAERGASPQRPTIDVDTVVDVRTDMHQLARVTGVLRELGVAPETSADGLQHRWRLDDAQIDVLLPDGIGPTARQRPGAAGGSSLPTPGGTQALGRSAAIVVDLTGRVGTVLRPSLTGALVMKAAAHAIDTGPGGRRHRQDLVLLSTLLTGADLREDRFTAKDIRRLRPMVPACRADHQAMALAGAEEGLARLELALGVAT